MADIKELSRKFKLRITVTSGSRQLPLEATLVVNIEKSTYKVMPHLLSKHDQADDIAKELASLSLVARQKARDVIESVYGKNRQGKLYFGDLPREDDEADTDTDEEYESEDA